MMSAVYLMHVLFEVCLSLSDRLSVGSRIVADFLLVLGLKHPFLA
jgi:hypothetical protein